MTDYAKTFFAPQLDETKKHGLIVLKDWIDRLYRVEEASELVHAELQGDVLTVTVDKSPVIEFMRSLNQEPSRYYIEETRTLYAAVADACGLDFELDYYNEDGGTRFKFIKK